MTKLAAFGAFARIEGPVEGLIHVSELVERRISHAQEAVSEGDVLPLRIIRIERDRHRLGLSLKQARDRGEVMGFTFGPDGDVLSVPEEIKAAFRDEVAALMREVQEGAEIDEVAATEVDVKAEDGLLEVPASPPGNAALLQPEEEDVPQTQMAAAFAALRLQDLTSDTPPDETKA